MQTLFDAKHREDLLYRYRRLNPNQEPRWGSMTPRQVVAHLIDQMKLTLGEATCEPMPGLLRYSPLRELALYLAPWPKGVKGPPEAFVTTPNNWGADLDRLTNLANHFAARGPDGTWPDHPRFGAMNGRDWGVFCSRHFRHHLAQFNG